MAKLIFITLPVTDLGRATAFYQAIGAEKNEQFSDATASCMVLSDTIHAMLATHDKFRQFTTKDIADARTATSVLLCVTAVAVTPWTTSSPRRRRPGGAPTRPRLTTLTSCMAAVSRIPTGTCGE